jgi:hypothetical protein
MTFSYQPLRCDAQRRYVLSHPKTAVKKLSLAALHLVVFLILGSVTGISAAAGRIADKFILYVHVARLYTLEPDQTIAMPIQDVSKKQIADTWHAPRGSDRLHEGQDIFAPQGTPVLSATEGYIVNIGENNLGGQTVSVVGAGGRSYYYAHLDSYAPHIAEGDYVTKQTVLGYVGNNRQCQRYSTPSSFRRLRSWRRYESVTTAHRSHSISEKSPRRQS